MNQEIPTHEVINPQQAPTPNSIIDKHNLGASKAPDDDLTKTSDGETNPDYGPEHQIDIVPEPKNAIIGLEKEKGRPVN